MKDLSNVHLILTDIYTEYIENVVMVKIAKGDKVTQVINPDADYLKSVILQDNNGIPTLVLSDGIQGNINNGINFRKYKYIITEFGHGRSYKAISELIEVMKEYDIEFHLITTNEACLEQGIPIDNISIVRDTPLLYEKIRKLTNKDLRPAHNLRKMYIAGSFDLDRK